MKVVKTIFAFFSALPGILNPRLKTLSDHLITRPTLVGEGASAAAMVKAYLRYEAAAAFGVIVSVEANITYDSSGKHLLAPALEKVGVWHVRQGVCTKTLSPSFSSAGPSLAVTSIAASPSSLVNLLALWPMAG